MQKHRSVILLGLFLVILASVTILARAHVAKWLDPTPHPRPVPPDIAKLVPERENGNLVGEWDRIEFPEAVIPVNWRKFYSDGKMTVRYGDEIIDGTYRILDNQTLETKFRFDGEIQTWTFAFSKDKLVMVNYESRWIEKYKRVPVGTLEPKNAP